MIGDYDPDFFPIRQVDKELDEEEAYRAAEKAFAGKVIKVHPSRIADDPAQKRAQGRAAPVEPVSEPALLREAPAPARDAPARDLRAETPKVETPKAETPKAETPKAEPLKVLASADEPKAERRLDPAKVAAVVARAKAPVEQRPQAPAAPPPVDEVAAPSKVAETLRSVVERPRSTFTERQTRTVQVEVRRRAPRMPSFDELSPPPGPKPAQDLFRAPMAAPQSPETPQPRILPDLTAPDPVAAVIKAAAAQKRLTLPPSASPLPAPLARFTPKTETEAKPAAKASDKTSEKAPEKASAAPEPEPVTPPSKTEDSDFDPERYVQTLKRKIRSVDEEYGLTGAPVTKADEEPATAEAKPAETAAEPVTAPSASTPKAVASPSAAPASAPIAAAGAEDPVKRGRGRPRKYPAVPTAAPVEPVPEPAQAVTEPVRAPDEEPAMAKKKTKSATKPAEPPRKRGRPRKITLTAAAAPAPAAQSAKKPSKKTQAGAAAPAPAPQSVAEAPAQPVVAEAAVVTEAAAKSKPKATKPAPKPVAEAAPKPAPSPAPEAAATAAPKPRRVKKRSPQAPTPKVDDSQILRKSKDGWSPFW